MEAYFLLDFALYKAQMPLLYDQCYLEMSYLIRELDRASFQKWVSLVIHFSNRDIPNPKDVPVELAGACAVIIAGRKSFERWVHESHPSLSDDLWGQFWLAAVAARSSAALRIKNYRSNEKLWSAGFSLHHGAQASPALRTEVRVP